MEILKNFWKSPTGPRTTHFWGPVFNWSLPIAVKIHPQMLFIVALSMA